MNLLKKYFPVFSILLILAFLPLYIENAYFNVVSAKFRAFFIAFLILVLPMLVLTGYRLVIKKEYISLNLSEGGILAYSLIALISCFFSGRVNDSFWGNDGWYIGAFTIIAVAFIYFFLSRQLEYNQNIWIPVYIVNTFIFIIAILQFARFDPLGFHDNILEKQYYQYISTIGNTNWFAGYLCILIPMVFVFFLEAKGRFSYLLNLGFLSLSLFDLLLCTSDGAYIGLAFSVFFAIPFVFSSNKRLKRTLLVLSILFAEGFLIGILPCYRGLLSYANGISKLFISAKLCLPLCIIFTLLYILTLLGKEIEQKNRKTICIILEVLFAISALAVLIYIVLNFNDSFGSSRGAIWRVSFENYSAYSIKEKLIGIGPELLRNEYAELQNTLFKGLAILSSHSEPVQALLSIGILGMAAWFAIFAGVLIKPPKKPLSYAFYLSVGAYFGQSFVNSATITNLCFLFIILAIYRKTTE